MTTENWIDLPTLQDVAKAKADEWEITYCHEQSDEWDEWNGSWWDDDYVFRGRPRQPKMKEVKLLAYLGSSLLYYYREGSAHCENTNLIRQPHLDMIAKVPA